MPHETQLHIRVPKELLRRLDSFAESHGFSRSAAIRAIALDFFAHDRAIKLSRPSGVPELAAPRKRKAG